MSGFDSPEVTLPPSGGTVTDTEPSVVVAYGPAVLFSSDTQTVTSQGTLGPGGSVTTSADIVNINKATSVPSTQTGSEVFTADRLQSSCTASETGVTASTTGPTGPSSVLSDDVDCCRRGSSRALRAGELSDPAALLLQRRLAYDQVVEHPAETRRRLGAPGQSLDARGRDDVRPPSRSPGLGGLPEGRDQTGVLQPCQLAVHGARERLRDTELAKAGDQRVPVVPTFCQEEQQVDG